MLEITWIDEPTYITDCFIKEVSKYGNFRVYYDRPDEDTLIKRLNYCDIAIVEWAKLNAEILSQVKRTNNIILVTTAYDQLDLLSAKKSGIIISNCPGYSSCSVAELVITGINAINRKLLYSNEFARNGEKHVYKPFLGKQLKGSILGLVGLGSIGQELIRIGQGLEMKLIGWSPSNPQISGLENVDEISQVFLMSDFISVQIPLSNRTKGFINKGLLQSMKRGSIFASVSRADIVDEDALYQLLKDEYLGGAYLEDVKDSKDTRLAEMKNTIVTTGIGWYTNISREKNLLKILETIKSIINSNPINVVK